MINPGAKNLNENSNVPLRWVFLSLGLSMSAIVGGLGAALAVGSWTTQVSLSQSAQSQRITNLEAQREQSLEFRRLLFEKIAILETKVDGLREDVKKDRSR